MSNVDKAESSVYIGFIFRCDREITPMEFVFREVLEVVLEFLKTEPRLMVKGVIGVDIRLVWVCWGGGGHGHEDEGRVRGMMWKCSEIVGPLIFR